MASSTQDYTLFSRGEWQVPKKYLKKAFWKEGQHARYYIQDHVQKEDTPVEFNFIKLTWGTVKYSNTHGAYKVSLPSPEELGLTIPGKEKADWSKWGPIDGASETDEDGNPINPTFWWNSDQEENHVPDKEVTIPQTDQEQEHEDQL